MVLPEDITSIKNKSETSVYVAMSGGVDSSTSAALLTEAGFDVVGCFMTVWQPSFLNCSMESERQDAMRVAAELNIPFKTVDLADEYRKQVVDYMIKEYKDGRTPNPDAMCNGEIKFGAFYDWAKDDGADFIATGHYARTRRVETDESRGVVELVRGVDETKDQSYFLWQLGQQELQNTLFPVGSIEKSSVRKTADDLGISVADKSDSQGLCFLGEVDMQNFLAEFIDLVPGDVRNERGETIGKHQGAEIYTVGQRRGFEVTDKTPDGGPWYVIEKNLDDNTITVSEDNSATGPVHNGKRIRLTNTNWINQQPDPDASYQAQIRYNQPAQPCTVKNQEDAWQVIFAEPLRAVASGQSCVIYDGDMCIGGGIIDTVTRDGNESGW